MKEITLEVPEGKRAEWINGVLTLVDEQKVDKLPIMERIKTFKDACNELGGDHPLCQEYYHTINIDCTVSKELIAYLKLQIITAALNDGWKPQFTTDEYHYFPWFCLYTQSEIDEMNEEDRHRVMYWSNYNANAYDGVAYTGTARGSSVTNTSIGYRLAFRTHELAEYAGKQFMDIYRDFMFSNELHTHN